MIDLNASLTHANSGNLTAVINGQDGGVIGLESQSRLVTSIGVLNLQSLADIHHGVNGSLDGQLANSGFGLGGRRCISAVQEGNDLGSLTHTTGAEGVGRGSGGDAPFLSPEDWLFVPASRFHIGENFVGSGGFWLLHEPPQESDHLGAVAGLIGGKFGGTDTRGDALLHSPENGIGVPQTHFHILEGIPCGLGCGRTGIAPQEGDNLGTAASQGRAEFGGADARGDALLNRPENTLIEIVGLVHINKGAAILQQQNPFCGGSRAGTRVIHDLNRRGIHDQRLPDRFQKGACFHRNLCIRGLPKGYRCAACAAVVISRMNPS